MSILGKPNGIFDLMESDRCVGSFLTKSDLCNILSVVDKDLDGLKFKRVNGLEVIDEKTVQKIWYEEKIGNAPPSRIGNAKISLDEYILKKLIQISFPDSKIEHQFKWGRKRIDFRVVVNNVQKFIEFDGPSHFAFMGRPPADPFERKKAIEDEFGIECVIWPYWIQRCTTNVKAIFDDKICGLGALWSTNIHFGDFYFDNSSEIIETINSRFNAERNGGFSYFYEKNTVSRNNPEHPIIEKILHKKEKIKRLLPKGFESEARWLPEKIMKIT